MATAEALNTLHGVGDKVSGVGRKVYGVQSALKAFEDRMRGVEDRVRGVEDTLQGVDVGVKDIRNKVINGVDTIFNWQFSSLSMFMYCFENQDDRMQPAFLRWLQKVQRICMVCVKTVMPTTWKEFRTERGTTIKPATTLSD